MNLNQWREEKREQYCKMLHTQFNTFSCWNSACIVVRLRAEPNTYSRFSSNKPFLVTSSKDLWCIYTWYRSMSSRSSFRADLCSPLLFHSRRLSRPFSVCEIHFKICNFPKCILYMSDKLLLAFFFFLFPSSATVISTIYSIIYYIEFIYLASI